MALEVLSEEEEEDEEENSFDHDDELSVSLPSADGVTITQEGMVMRCQWQRREREEQRDRRLVFNCLLPRARQVE